MVRVPADEVAEPHADAVAHQAGSGAVRVEYYTDPLCCWSWAMEPVWADVRRHYGDALVWRYVLGGMIEGWASFRDPLNDVVRPAQLAPLWQMAGRLTGVAIDPSIWHVDPPASSWPACVAVKAAELQGAAAGERYLALVREAVMRRRLNVARQEVLLQLAAELAAAAPAPVGFDPEQFARDMPGEEATRAFTADLERARFRSIGRFPTIVAHGPAGSRIAVGYRPSAVLEEMLRAVGGGPSAAPTT